MTNQAHPFIYQHIMTISMTKKEPEQTPKPNPETNQELNLEPRSKKSHKMLILLAAVIACLAVFFVFFRPVTNEEVVQEDGEPKVYEKVIYEVDSWQAQPVIAMMEQDKFDKVKSLISATATKTDGLDFDGRPAVRYDYTTSSEPPLYVIESDEIFELSWYFAAPKDSDRVKQMSQKHAQKAYALATALYGDDGKVLMKAMLSQTQAEKTLMNRHRLRLAECRDYTCQLVMQK